MSDKPSSNEQLDAAKRYVSEVVEDMRMRNLLLPAIALLVAIVAAIFVLPNRSEPVVDTAPPTPAPAQTQPVANQTPEPIEITLVTPTAIGSSGPLDASRNPFMGNSNYDCSTVSSGPPRVLDCQVSDLRVRVFCPISASEPPCGSGTQAAEGGTGSTGAGGAGGATEQTGGGGGDDSSDDVKIYVYQATVRLDGKTHRRLDLGDAVPPTGATVVTFERVSTNGKTAYFKLPTGSSARPAGGYVIETKDASIIQLTKGRSARITDTAGEVHTLRLESLTRKKA